MDKLRVAFNIVREHSEVEKISQKMKYDKHTTQRVFHEGDLVLVATTASQIGDNSTRRKLQPIYQGPCRIMEQLAPSTFVINRISDNVNLGATNADRLKHYYEPKTEPKNSQTTVIDLQDEPSIQNNPEITSTPQTTLTPENRVVRRPPSSRQRQKTVRFQV